MAGELSIAQGQDIQALIVNGVVVDLIVTDAKLPPWPVPNGAQLVSTAATPAIVAIGAPASAVVKPATPTL